MEWEIRTIRTFVKCSIASKLFDKITLRPLQFRKASSSPRIDGTDTNFTAPFIMHFLRFKSCTLDSLKRLLNAFSKKPSLRAPDKRMVTSHNLPVNLPVKGQATAKKKTLSTIETSSEKINLGTYCKGKIIGFKGQCEREVLIPISSKASISSLSESISSVSWHALSLTWGTLAKWMIFLAELTFLSPWVVNFAHRNLLFRNANFFLI